MNKPDFHSLSRLIHKGDDTPFCENIKISSTPQSLSNLPEIQSLSIKDNSIKSQPMYMRRTKKYNALEFTEKMYQWNKYFQLKFENK